MPAMSNYLENKLIDAIFREVAYTFPTALYVGLYTTAPTAAGGGTEVTGGAYARAALTPSAADWAATNAPGSTANPSSGTSGQTSNNATITFPTATASWGTVTSFGIFDGATGNLLFFGNLTSSQAIASGVTPSFAAGALSINLS